MASLNGHPARSESGRETFLALVLMLFAGSGAVLFLIFVSAGFFAWVIVTALGIATFGLFHYWLWGRAFMHSLEREREEWRQEQELEQEEYGRPPWDRRY